MSIITTERPLTVQLTNDEANAAVYALALETTSEAEALGDMPPSTLPGHLFKIGECCRRVADLADICEQLRWRAHWGPMGGDAPAITAGGAVLLDMVSVLNKRATDRAKYPEEDAYDGAFAFEEAARNIAAAYSTAHDLTASASAAPSATVAGDDGTTTIDIPRALLPGLRETTVRELAIRADPMAHIDPGEDADRFEAGVVAMSVAIEDHRALAGPGPFDRERVLRLLELHIDWQAGCDFALPSDLDEFAPVDIQRKMIELRDSLAGAVAT